MALDKPKDSDTVMEIDGFTYLVDTDFYEKVKPIKVDFEYIGFKLTCGVDFGAGGCTSCGTDKSCCG